MNALTCQKCKYDSTFPQADRKCNQSTIKCAEGIKYCFTGKYTDSSDVVHVLRDCDTRNYCPDAKKTCDNLKKIEKFKSCKGDCCQTDKCNNYDPTSSTATGIMVSKFALILMVIAGLLSS